MIAIGSDSELIRHHPHATGIAMNEGKNALTFFTPPCSRGGKRSCKRSPRAATSSPTRAKGLRSGGGASSQACSWTLAASATATLCATTSARSPRHRCLALKLRLTPLGTRGTPPVIVCTLHVLHVCQIRQRLLHHDASSHCTPC